MAAPFKAYDIRGVYPEELDESLAEAIGNATAVQLGLSGKTLPLVATYAFHHRCSRRPS